MSQHSVPRRKKKKIATALLPSIRIHAVVYMGMKQREALTDCGQYLGDVNVERYNAET
jgi:hypothetical protein